MAVQLILQQAGPLPITTTFNAVSDAEMYLEVNGSVWATYENVIAGIEIWLDGKPLTRALIFSNAPATHRTVVPAYIPVTLAPGPHTLKLATSTSGVSDSNDFYTAVLHY